MFNLFNKKKDVKFEENNLLNKTASLLIHAAKIDENLTEKEKEIIKKTLIELGSESNQVEEIYKQAEISEKNANQILDFTREIKNAD